MQQQKKKLINKIYTSQLSYNRQIPGPFGNRYLTYADYIASGQPLRFIEKFIQKVVLPTYANTHTESSFTGLQSTNYREEARAVIKKAVNASDQDELIFTGSGSTAAINLMFRKLMQRYEERGEKYIVFIGPYEHHSNILPWREGPFDLVEIPMAKDGNVDLEVLKNELIAHQGKGTLIGSFSAASNVTGVLAPINEIHSLLKNYEALSFWDFAGAAPYVKIDMNPEQKQGLDAVFISPHKFIGGPGSPGLLIVKKDLFSHGLPVTLGGGTVQFVTKTSQKYHDEVDVREEGGTPGIIESIRAGLSFQLKEEVGAELIEFIERDYIQRAIKRLGESKNIYILGNLEIPRLGFLAFHINYKNRFLHHNFVVALLNDFFGIQARGGCSCAGPYGHDLLNINNEVSEKYVSELQKGNGGSKPGWVRLNFNYFIPEEEFDYILKCLIWISENGWKVLPLYFFDDESGLWRCKKSPKMPINSIGSFLTKNNKIKKGTSLGKKMMRKSYLKKADKIANETFASLQAGELQLYKYDQINNPLRWYALSHDILKD